MEYMRLSPTFIAVMLSESSTAKADNVAPPFPLYTFKTDSFAFKTAISRHCLIGKPECLIISVKKDDTVNEAAFAPPSIPPIPSAKAMTIMSLFLLKGRNFNTATRSWFSFLTKPMSVAIAAGSIDTLRTDEEIFFLCSQACICS